MAQHQDAQGYRLEFEIRGFTGPLGSKDLEVRITRPDGSGFLRTSLSGDIVVLDEGKCLVGVTIKTGDFTKLGEHHYQAFDVTDGIFVPTDIQSFHVNQNLVV